LSALNQESWFMRPAPVARCRVSSAGLPPKLTARTPLVPSSKVEATITEPLGSARYGVPRLADVVRLSVVSLSRTLRT
jgi:hypothetical protein